MNTTCQSAAIADRRFGPQVDECVREFDFTVRFEDAILSILPSIIFLFVVPFRLMSLKNQRHLVGCVVLRNTKLIFVLCFGVLQLCLLAVLCRTPSWSNPVSIAAATLSLLDSIAFGGLSYLEHLKSLRPSILLNTYLFFSLLFDAVRARSLWLRGGDVGLSALFTASLAVKAIMLILESWKKSPLDRASKKRSEESAGIFGLSLFLWLNQLVIHGFRKLLHMKDLYPIAEKMSAASLHSRFLAHWTSDVDSDRRNRKLIWAVVKSLKVPLLAPIPARVALIAFTFSQPLLVNRLLDYLGEPEGSNYKNIGYGLIASYGLVYTGMAISQGLYSWSNYRAITMIRGLLVSAIYKKTIEISITALDNSSSVTLMSADVQKIVDGLQKMHEVWASIIEIGVATYLLKRQIGLACIAPILIAVVSGGVTIMLASGAGEFQKTWMDTLQKRVGVTASMISVMKGVKLTGLSDKLGKMIQELRIQELRSAARFRLVLVWTVGAAFAPYALSPVLTFAMFVAEMRLRHEVLNTSIIFTSVSLLVLVANPLSQIFQAVPSFAAAFSCFDRIEGFLVSIPRQDNRLAKLPSASKANYSPHPRAQDKGTFDTNSDNLELKYLFGSTYVIPDSQVPLLDDAEIIAVRNGSFGWSATGTSTIKDINLTIKRTDFIILVGPVASGKSTLLKAFLGETLNSKGFVYIAPDLQVAFCDQTPWLPNKSARESIIGISDFDEGWYNAVVNSCALRDDLDRFPSGDQTLVGSNGITLSGGQKQRLAIARAVYARKTVVILDDVFSGLDSHTQRHVFNNLLGPEGILRRQNATVILATHAMNLLPFADHIIALSSDGKISEQGSFVQLSTNGGYVESFGLHKSSASEEETVEETTDDVPIGRKAQSQEGPLPLAPDTEENPTRQTGDFTIYFYYFKSIGLLNGIVFLLLEMSFTFFEAFPNVWLSFWTGANEINPGARIGYYLGIYSFLQVNILLFILAVAWHVLGPLIVTSGAYLHQRLLDSVIAAPMSLFNAMDTGIITNRFSQDIMLIDSDLPLALLNFVASALLCVAQAALISVASKYVSIMIPFLALILYFIQKLYLRTSRQLRFMDLEAKSPLYTHFLESLSGLATIRAFGWENVNRELNSELLDTSQKPFYLLFMIQRWLTLVLDLTAAAIAVIVVAIAVRLGSSSSAGLTGVALVNLISFNDTIKGLIMVWTNLETSIGAISRIRSFTESTASENMPGETTIPPDSWPQHGHMELSSLSATYKQESDNVITNLSFTIKAGEKVGICGRSGSGKSSLVLALFRMLELNTGTISIDGLDISQMPREYVRARLNAIPQEPLFLAGTVRMNVDPYEVAEVESVRGVLKKVGLLEKIESKGGLDVDMKIDLLSHGERQLFCLARAILRPGKIVVLDEVTSNVDRATDKVMQRIIRDEFKDHTVIAVAHNLETIMDFDRIAVLDKGRLIEFDTPRALLETDSVFKGLYEVYKT